MRTNKYAPGTRSEHAGAIVAISEDTQNFSYHQKRILRLLSDGVPRTVADISIALRLSDPRSVIRDLRHKGVAISDVWCPSVHGGRFKRYFIRKGVAS